MSALAKPGIYCAGAVAPNNARLIPAEYLFDVSKMDVTATPQTGSVATYYLIFKTLNPYSQAIKIPFPDSTSRDTSFTNVKTTLGTSVA